MSGKQILQALADWQLKLQIRGNPTLNDMTQRQLTENFKVPLASQHPSADRNRLDESFVFAGTIL